jgi:thiol-disulfide isomerase/thioredoxin
MGPQYSGPNVRIVINDLKKTGRQCAAGLILAVILALAAAGCGSSEGGDYGGRHPDYAKALAGSPAPLAALHKQANQLLSGGLDAYQRRLASLAGYPTVVNIWASWCGPCRFEFPTLQKLSAAYGKRVAFLGVDNQDSDDAAQTFLGEAPLSYPSYTDPGGGIVEELGGRGGIPDTAFYGRGGKLVYLKQGPYTNPGELRADVEHYALGLSTATESG